MRIKCLTIALTLAMGLCLVPNSLFAELTDEVQRVMRLIQEEKKSYVEREMKLSPEKSKDFWPVYESYQRELKQISEKYILFVWSRIEGVGFVSSDKAQTTIKEYLELEREKLELKDAFIEKFAGVLPPGKLLRYYQLETRAETFANSNIEKKIPLLE